MYQVKEDVSGGDGRILFRAGAVITDETAAKHGLPPRGVAITEPAATVTGDVAGEGEATEAPVMSSIVTHRHPATETKSTETKSTKTAAPSQAAPVADTGNNNVSTPKDATPKDGES